MSESSSTSSNVSSNVETWLTALEKAGDNPSAAFNALSHLARHYRFNRHNRVATMFIREALKYNRKDVQFEDFCRLMEDLSIVGYYINDNNAREAIAFLVLMKGVPNHLYNQAFTNQIFYIHQHPSKSHTKLSIPTNDPYKSSSACLLFDKEEQRLVGVVRGVNYSIDSAFRYYIRPVDGISGHIFTQNYWVTIGMDGTVDGCSTLQLSGENVIQKQRNIHIHGFEDMRITKVGNRFFGVATDWEHGRHGHGSIVLCHISTDITDRVCISKVIPITYGDEKLQKNWTMFAENEELYLCYSHQPLILLKIDTVTGNYEEILNKPSPFNLSQVRGSANPIKIGENMIFLIHEVVSSGTRKYYHRWIEYNKDWEVVGISEPFFFKKFFVEFTLSVSVISDDEWLIVFSNEDNSTEWITIDPATIPWLSLYE